MKKISVFLLIIMLLGFCCSIDVYCVENDKTEKIALEKQLLVAAFQNYLNKYVRKMPLILFPKSEVGYLKNLRELMREEYFTVPEIRDVTFKKKKKKYRIDEDVYTDCEFTFSNFLVKGLPIDRVSFAFSGLVLDQEKLKKKKFHVLSAASADFTMEVTVDELGRFISEEASKQGTVMPAMSTEGLDIVLQGPMKFMDYQGSVFVKGTSFVDRKNMLRFKIKKCITGENSVPGFIVDTISNIVNPLMLFKKFMFDLETKDILVKGNKIFLVAEAMKFKKKKYEVKYKSKSLLKYLKK